MAHGTGLIPDKIQFPMPVTSGMSDRLSSAIAVGRSPAAVGRPPPPLTRVGVGPGGGRRRRGHWPCIRDPPRMPYIPHSTPGRHRCVWAQRVPGPLLQHRPGAQPPRHAPPLPSLGERGTSPQSPTLGLTAGATCMAYHRRASQGHQASKHHETTPRTRKGAERRRRQRRRQKGKNHLWLFEAPVMILQTHTHGAHKSVPESANPRLDSEGASGCPWSTARATARLRDGRPPE